MKIRISSDLFIYDYEVVEKFVRASGPGGQKVNKSSTAVHFFFNIPENRTLPEYIRKKLMQAGGCKVSSEGVLTIKAMRYKSQEKNRDDAFERLKKIIMNASVKPEKRIATKPSKSSKENRLKEKKVKSVIKKMRQKSSILNDD